MVLGDAILVSSAGCRKACVTSAVKLLSTNQPTQSRPNNTAHDYSCRTTCFRQKGYDTINVRSKAEEMAA